MSEQERMRGRAIHFPKGSQPNVELSRRKHREGQQSQQGSGRRAQISKKEAFTKPRIGRYIETGRFWGDQQLGRASGR